MPPNATNLKRSHGQVLETPELESLRVMVAGIVHDFNTLLGGILAESDLALSELPPESPARENVQHVNALAVRASEIVDLLRACVGGGGTALEAVDLSKVVAEMLTVFEVSLPSGVVLETRLDHSLPAIRANPAQIRRVVLNVIKNGLEALQNKEGTITVTTGRAADPPSELPEGDYARLLVSDTGCGIPPKDRAKIFDPFYTTKFSGRGLGLAVVQEILRSCGGAMTVVSTPGRGSTFEVLLPCVSRRPRAMSKMAPEAAELSPVLPALCTRNRRKLVSRGRDWNK